MPKVVCSHTGTDASARGGIAGGGRGCELRAGHGTNTARAQVAAMLNCRTSSGLAAKCKLQLLSRAEVCQRQWEFHPALRGHPEKLWRASPGQRLCEWLTAPAPVMMMMYEREIIWGQCETSRLRSSIITTITASISRFWNKWRQSRPDTESMWMMFRWLKQPWRAKC